MKTIMGVSSMSSYSRQQLERWVSSNTVNSGRVLDVGGSQLPIWKRVKVEGDTQFDVLDLASPHQVIASPDIVHDINEPIVDRDGKLLFDFEPYDNVFCIEVSEYWWNPVQAVENISLLTKRGGRAYFSFHFVYPLHNPAEQDYLRYTESGVRKLLSHAGFETEELEYRNSEVSNLMTFYSAEQMRPNREYRHHNATGFLVIARKK